MRKVVLLLWCCVYTSSMRLHRGPEFKISNNIMNELPFLRHTLKNSEVIEISRLFDNLKQDIEYLPLIEHEVIKSSLTVAYISHNGEYRNSGESYIEHPVAVAKILASSCVDCDTIVAALLHDVVENTLVTLDNIQEIYGSGVCRIVCGVTKVSKLSCKSREQIPKMEDYMNKKTARNENLRNMFIAMSDDWRIIQVKVASKLHNLRTLDQEPKSKQKKVATDALELYAPLAHRLGMYAVKTELEDLSFCYLQPRKFKETRKKLNERSRSVEQILDVSKQSIEELLIGRNFNYKIESRIKSTYSTWVKMQDRGGDIERILDVVALRIILDDSEESIEMAFGILGKVHSIWEHLPYSTKDYINRPKPNGYQSLHTTVLIDNQPLEIQIRTTSMHQVAEYGEASHISYKEDTRVPWLRVVKELDETVSSSEQFVKQIRERLLNSNTFVFSPNGDVLKLKKGTMMVDLRESRALLANANILINGEVKLESYEFQNGDVIEFD